MDVDRVGVKVVGLGVLNKNEVLNGGGVLFVNKYGKFLKMRVVYGNMFMVVVIL